MADDGHVIVSALLSTSDLRVLGFEGTLMVIDLGDGHLQFLPWHRQLVFKGR